MAWVRIEDTAPEHRKHLKAGPSACWLWVCGIAYCQRQLTDGFIPAEVVNMLGVTKGAPAMAEKLVEVGLFDRAEGGYRVHDYLDHNASRTEAISRRQQVSEERSRAGKRGAATRWQRDSKPHGNEDGKQDGKPIASPNGKPIAPSHPIPSHPGTADAVLPSPRSPVDRRHSGDRRSGRPIFSGQRITVFEWMFDDISKILGPHTEAFGLDEWFYEADRLAMAEAVVARDWWPFVQSALLAEAAKRGLRVVNGEALKVQTPTIVAGCRHRPPCSDAAEHTRRDIADRRQVPA